MALESSKLAPENWVNNIKNVLSDKEATENIQICVAKVPKELRDIKPEVYTPQLMGLGPYHHWREELYDMEHYKLIAAKKAQKGCQDDQAVIDRLNQLVNGLTEDCIPKIRACYDTNLNVDDHTLAWMMVIDSIFLLQFLQTFVDKGQSCLIKSKRTSYLIQDGQSAYHSILKDIMKLENQIPIFFLKEMLSTSDIAHEDLLSDMILSICKKLSPLTCHEGCLKQPITSSYAHLLDLVYYMIVPEAESTREDDRFLDRNPSMATNPDDHQANREQENLSKRCLPNLKIPAVSSFEMVGKLNIKLVNTMPMKAIASLSGLLTQVISLKNNSSGGIEDPESGGNLSSSEGTPKTPRIEEIEIPSVSNLLSVGIQIIPITQGSSFITSMKFDTKSGKLYLPVVTIDKNTEVILSNLVAYESEAIRGPQILSRYTEFMNGIIDTPEDVKLLRERNIIESFMKTDDDVAALWNRMSKSSRLSHVRQIRDVTKEVNNYYDNKKRVKFYRFTKGCMFTAWKILMLILVLAVVALMTTQSFCSVYSSCPQLFRPDADKGTA